MSWASSEIVEVLTFLLPGFIAAGIFFPLTSHPKPSPFASVIHALIFTMIVQVIVFLLPLEGLAEWLGTNSGETVETDRNSDGVNFGLTEVIVSVPIAVLLGLLASYVTNHDYLFAALRWIRATRETSYPSEWYSSFVNHENTYVVLHLNGQRRLFGWLEEYPSSPDHGHFRIAEASWLTGDGEVALPNVTAIVVPVDQVEMVEFVQPETKKNGTE